MLENKNFMLSVIIPVYNVEQYLRNCIDSILSQEYDNMEIICVNDGSLDQSGEIIDEYCQKDKRIIHIKKENGGLVSARKTGILAARGKYAANIDSDDWVEFGMFSKMMSVIEREDVDVVCSGIIRDYGDCIKKEPIGFDEGLYTGEKLTNILSNMVSKRFIKYNIAPHLVTKICKLDLLEKAYLPIPDDTNLDEDVISLYPMLLQSKSIYLIKDCYYHYCSRNNSIVNTVNAKEISKIKSTYRYLKTQFEKYKEEIPDIMRQYQYLETYANLLVQPEKVLEYKNEHLFPYGAITPDSKVVIYGTGSFFSPLYNYIQENTDLEIVAVADGRGDGEKILRACDLKNVEFDYILISVILADIVDAIVSDLESQGIDKDKILYIYKEEGI